MSEEQSPPGYLVSCALEGPSGSFPKSTINLSLATTLLFILIAFPLINLLISLLEFSSFDNKIRFTISKL